jgi:hypothetical protein
VGKKIGARFTIGLWKISPLFLGGQGTSRGGEICVTTRKNFC